ncbi:TPA: hypothetical protein RQK52_004404 [Vibrio vulnificus]|nr:hypothetical protein [Vibrio vulnificus]HDY7988231.1 hypothetical protein [Vibrio vulnificus]
MLNHVKSVVHGFSLFPRLIGFEFVGKLASVVAVFWTPIRVFASAKNSESYLNQFSGKREVRGAGSISNLILGF